MPTEYSEQDTERARWMDRSSAGASTQRLATVPPIEPLPQVRKERNLAAIVLITIGVLSLLGYLSSASLEITGGLVILTIASCFLFFSLWKRIYGLLIPGCLLAGLSVGVTFAPISNGASVLWGLALGFLSILFVGRSLFRIQSNWPIYPAVPLFAVGVIIAITSLPSLFAGGLIWLPLLLIGAGLYLGWGRPTR